MSQILQLRGRNALSAFRHDKLQQTLAQIAPAIEAVAIALASSARYRNAMRLHQYLQLERGRAAAVARALAIPAAWLSQMATGARPIPERLGAPLEAACELRVRRWDEWPKTWHLIWPELLGTEGAPEAPRRAGKKTVEDLPSVHTPTVAAPPSRRNGSRASHVPALHPTE